MMRKFKSIDICVITPTKDRPNKIFNLLDSLNKQTQKVGRIIIVSSGQNIKDVVMDFKNKLPIEYFHTEISGQIRQRKIALQKLNSNTKLVATLDDDIILEPDAIEKLLKYWNSKDENTAGIGFNIINMPGHRNGILKALVGASEKLPGKVLKSGYVTQITNVKTDTPTQWLNGGATVWHQEILIKNMHQENIDAKWAPFEDLIFSYPIGKKFNLFICFSAKVLHDDIVHSDQPFSFQFYRGKATAFWNSYFVIQNPELSLLASFWAMFVQSISEIVKFLIKFKFKQLGMPLGRCFALHLILFYLIVGKEIKKLIK